MRTRVVCATVIAMSGCRPDVTHSDDSGTTAMATGGTDDSGEPAEPPGLPYESGSRLRARVLDGAGGAKLFLSWHDTELDIDCAFAPTSEGTLLCLPRPPSTVVYLDTSCTEPALWLHSDSVPPTYVSVANDWGAGMCDRTRDPFAVGEALPDDTPLYGGASCQPYELPADYVAYALEPADDDVFVSVERTSQPRGDALAVEMLSGSDGSWQLGDVFDVARDLRCHPSPPDADDLQGHARCIPNPGGGGPWLSSAYYTDANCSEPLAYTCFIETCTSPTHIALSQSCSDPPYVVHELGSMQTEGYTQSTPGSCEAAEISYDSDTCPYFPIEESVSLDQFPAATIVEHGEGRLRAMLFVAADQTAASVPGVFWDNDLQRTCRPREIDGTLVCISAPQLEITAFEDDSCTKNLVAADGCAMPSYVVFDSNPYDGMLLEPRYVLPVTGRFEGTTAYVNNASQCEPFEVTQELWRLAGDSTDPADAFHGVEERIE